MAPGMRTGIVAIDELPKNGETLWLRLLGKGDVQKQAINRLVRKFERQSVTAFDHPW